MISILMPIYNGIEYINESVYSILEQTFTEWELIIGINGHPENSDVFQIAKKFETISPKIKVYDLLKIKGKSNALNAMLQFCNYSYVALLDVDDIWLHNKLQIQSKYLGIYDIIGTGCVWFGDIEGVIPKIPLNNISKRNFEEVNPIINSSSVIRKELCYWNEEWDGVEDYDMWLRLRKQNKKFFNCPYILVKHRIHKQSAFNGKGNNDKVDNLLISHGFKSRKERQIAPSKINIPYVNKMKMNIL